MKLNDENIDELMFQLLEGEILGEERTRLLDAINADKSYSKQWQAWQQTILNPDMELLVMNTGRLIKKENKSVIMWWKYCAAAVIVLAVSIFVYIGNRKDELPLVKHEAPVNNKLQIIKVPSIDPVVNIKKSNDSILSMKQKVPMMVVAPKQESIFPESEFKYEPILVPKAPVFIAEQPKDEKKDEVPVINLPKKESGSEEKVNTLSKEENGVIMTVYEENGSKKPANTIGSKIDEKRNLLSRIFSVPKFRIVNDSSTYTNRKIILENKAYKIIAGF